tara:strand:+ start:6639 stop:6917 length:279 start_codon:yes stop_codon:yes gene_type:complete
VEANSADVLAKEVEAVEEILKSRLEATTLGLNPIFYSSEEGWVMPQLRLFNGPIGRFLREHKLIRRVAFVGGVLVGLYFLGASQGWWSRFLF